MEALINWIGNINLMPFFDSLLTTVTEPFNNGFQLMVASFEPYYHSLLTREPGLVAGILFLLVSWSVVSMLKKRFRAKAFVPARKPEAFIRESYPGRN